MYVLVSGVKLFHDPGNYFHMLTSIDTCGDRSRCENTQTSGNDKSE